MVCVVEDGGNGVEVELCTFPSDPGVAMSCEGLCVPVCDDCMVNIDDDDAEEKDEGNRDFQ